MAGKPRSEQSAEEQVISTLVELFEFIKKMFQRLYKDNNDVNFIKLSNEELDDLSGRLEKISKEQIKLAEENGRTPLEKSVLLARSEMLDSIRNSISNEPSNEDPNKTNRELLLENPINFSPEAFAGRAHDSYKRKLEDILSDKTYTEASADIKSLKTNLDDLASLDQEILGKNLNNGKPVHMALYAGMSAVTSGMKKSIDDIERSPAKLAGKEAEAVYEHGDPNQDKSQPARDRNMEADRPEVKNPHPGM